MLLITTPVSQHFWTWDRFLQGGRDFEMGAVTILSFLSLALVLSKSYKQCVDVVLSAQRLLAARSDLVLPATSRAAAFSSRPRVGPLDAVVCISSVTIQI